MSSALVVAQRLSIHRLLQGLHEGPNAGLKFRIACGRGQEDADTPHALALLRPRRKRPCRGAAEERE
jgi:hypothetical protein